MFKWNLEINSFEMTGKGEVEKESDGQCLESLERAGIIKKFIVGGSRTIGVNDRFETETEAQHCGISIKSLRS